MSPPPLLPQEEDRGEAVAGPSSSPASVVASGVNLFGRGEGSHSAAATHGSERGMLSREAKAEGASEGEVVSCLL